MKKHYTKERRGGSEHFWNKEYKGRTHLALSDEASEDFVKFTRWLTREYGGKYLNKTATALDMGCGNGRNLVYLARNFGIRGIGYDVSSEATGQAKRLSAGLPIEYKTRSITEPLPLPDMSQTIVLDMMTSHFLRETERKNLLAEIARVLRPGGWLFLKTFLRDEDVHAERLLRDHPAEEAGSYIHPESGLAEHVFTEEELVETLAPYFAIHKITKSHRHKGGDGKRRSVSMYAKKN